MTPTGLSSYTSKHTFSERLICSEYRSLYCSAAVNEVHEPNKCVQTGDDRQHRMLICLQCGGKAAHGPESPVPTPFSARKPASAKGGRLLRRHSCDLERRPASSMPTRRMRNSTSSSADGASSKSTGRSFRSRKAVWFAWRLPANVRCATTGRLPS